MTLIAHVVRVFHDVSFFSSLMNELMAPEDLMPFVSRARTNAHTTSNCLLLKNKQIVCLDVCLLDSACKFATFEQHKQILSKQFCTLRAQWIHRFIVAHGTTITTSLICDARQLHIFSNILLDLFFP